ncbi:hypothetical protein CUMW_130630 [Citrus unshiu]|nr:hypothetical protein CUMW_130630 [Citrus unshiu]
MTPQLGSKEDTLREFKKQCLLNLRFRKDLFLCCK